MLKRKNSLYYLQIISQIAFLILFVVLIIIGRIQIWMAIFLLSLVLTLLLGRFYCGWLCPIRSIQRMQTTVKKALRIKSGKGPSWLRNIYSRYIFLAIFLLLMAIILISGRQLPVLPAMLVIGVFLTFFFSESLWHRWLCPYGTLLRLPALASRKRLQINQSKCNSCGICISVCPSDAIKNFAAEKSNDSNMKDSYRLNSAECLLCLECVRSCPPRSISYNRNIQN